MGSWNSDFRRLLGILLFILGVLAVAPPVCRAQTFELGLTGGYTRLNEPALGAFDTSELNGKDDDVQLIGDKYVEGIRFTANLWNYYGVEGEYLRTGALVKTRNSQDDGTGTAVVTTGEDKIHVNQISVNMIAYFMPRTRRWRPFITAGLGRATFGEPRIDSWFRGSSTNYGFNYGGGIKLTPFRHAVIRLDARQYFSGKPWDPIYVGTDFKFGGIMHHWEATVGIGASF